MLHLMLGHLRRLEIVKTFIENKFIEGIIEKQQLINLRRKSHDCGILMAPSSNHF